MAKLLRALGPLLVTMLLFGLVATAPVAAAQGKYDLDVATATTVVGSSTVGAGSNVTFAVKVTNLGSADASAADVHVIFPAGLIYNSGASSTNSPTWSCTTAVVSSITTLDCVDSALFTPGTTFTFTLVAKVDPMIGDATTLNTTVDVSAFKQGPSAPPAANDTYDLNPANNHANLGIVATNRATVTVTKTVAPATVLSGGTLLYNITVKNSGPNPFVNATLTDTIDPNVDVSALVIPAGWTCNGQTGPGFANPGTLFNLFITHVLTCTNPSFSVGTVLFPLTVIVRANTPGGTVIKNQACIASAFTRSLDSANGCSNVATSLVRNRSAVTITKTRTSQSPIDPGANITYDITVNNTGPDAALNAKMTDTLPAHTTFVSLTVPSGWNCNTPAYGSTGTVSCMTTTPAPLFTDGTVGFGPGSATFTLTVQTDFDTPAGNLNNTASQSNTSSPGGTTTSGPATTVINSNHWKAPGSGGGGFA